MRRSKLARTPTPALALLLGAVLACAGGSGGGNRAAEAFEAAPSPVSAASDSAEGEAYVPPAEDVAVAPAAQRKPWDQARMTELTAQLATQTADLRRTFRREPNFRNPKTPNQRAVNQLEDTLRQLQNSSRSLSRQVANGGGHDETVGTARRIGMLLNDADMWGRRIMTSEFMAQRIRPTMQTINEIAPFYGSGPLFDPETMQRLNRPPNPDRPRAEE